MSRSLCHGFWPMLWLPVLYGCVSNSYEVTLTPEGGKLKREISIWRGTGDKPENPQEFPSEELRKIAQEYKAEIPEKRDQKHTFTANFADTMPQDVGGKGTYQHWETSLGSLSGYVERFRGNDDLLADVEARLRICDRLTDLLIGWLGSHLKNEPGFGELKEFLDGPFRRDLKNLSLYEQTLAIAEKTQSEGLEADAFLRQFKIRVVQYFLERGYFSIEELPSLSRAFSEMLHNDPTRILGYLKRFLATKMGLPQDQALPKSLAFLDNAEVLEKSVNDFLRQTEDYKKLLADYEKNRASDPDAKRPKPFAVVETRLHGSFSVFRFAGDKLTVTLASPVEPHETNGQWNAETKQVAWSQRLLERDSKRREFPSLCYAFWSEPDTKAQTARFGRVLLKGDALGQYCLWYHGLTETEAQEWETFLVDLRPGKNLAARLRAFRFSQERPAEDGEDPKGLAAEPCQLLLQSLGEEGNDGFDKE